MNKLLFLPLILLTFAFAQPKISIDGSIGYDKIVIDYYEFQVGNNLYYYEKLPVNVYSFGIAASALIPITDIAQLDARISIGYMSGTASTDEPDWKEFDSKASLNLFPKIRFGKEEKIYASIGLGASIPLLCDIRQTSRYGTYTYDINDIDPETLFAAALSGRYNYFGAGLGKVLNGGDNATSMGVSIFITIFEQFEIVPSIGYSVGNIAKQYSMSVGIDYSL